MARRDGQEEDRCMRRGGSLVMVACVSRLAACAWKGAPPRHAPTSSARPCLPPGFGYVPSGIVPSDPALPPKAGPQSPFALMQQALIREVPCVFTGLEFTGDPSSTGLEERPDEPARYAVLVAPLGPAELAAIDKVEAEFPDFELVGVEARQSYAEADLQIDAITAVIGHYSSSVGMEKDGSVTALVEGVPEDL